MASYVVCGTKSKECQRCGSRFFKRHRDSADQWALRTYCSALCSNRAKAPSRIPLESKFWGKVEKRSEGCWGWSGATDGHGYGTMGAGGNKGGRVRATRVSWEIHFGPIPKMLVVMHLCDNPICTNPNHLVLGTQKANSFDASRKGRLNPKSLENLKGNKYAK